MGLFSSGMLPQLQTALNASSMNQKLIAENLANVDTPNYKAKHLSFSQQLNQSILATQTDPRHLPFSTGSGFRVITDSSTVMQNNGNNVDVDKEMTDLAKNQIDYQALVELLNNRFSDIRTVIRGGN